MSMRNLERRGDGAQTLHCLITQMWYFCMSFNLGYSVDKPRKKCVNNRINSKSSFKTSYKSLDKPDSKRGNKYKRADHQMYLYKKCGLSKKSEHNKNTFPAFHFRTKNNPQTQYWEDMCDVDTVLHIFQQEYNSHNSFGKELKICINILRSIHIL